MCVCLLRSFIFERQSKEGSSILNVEKKMGKVISCLGLKTPKSESHNLTANGNSFKINDDQVLDTRASKENLLDENDGLNVTKSERQNAAKPNEVKRSKTMQKAIETQELLDKTFNNDNKPSSVSEEPNENQINKSEESNTPLDMIDGQLSDRNSVPPELPEQKKSVERTLSTESDYDVPIASKTLQEDPYDLPRESSGRDRIESDYDELPQRKQLTRTLSDDDYDELPVRKSTDQLNQFSQNNNNDEDNDYDELPPGKPVKQIKPVQSDEDDYDELPVRNNKPQVDDSEYDVPKEWESKK